MINFNKFIDYETLKKEKLRKQKYAEDQPNYKHFSIKLINVKMRILIIIINYNDDQTDS